MEAILGIASRSNAENYLGDLKSMSSNKNAEQIIPLATASTHSIKTLAVARVVQCQQVSEQSE